MLLISAVSAQAGGNLETGEEKEKIDVIEQKEEEENIDFIHFSDGSQLVVMPDGDIDFFPPNHVPVFLKLGGKLVRAVPLPDGTEKVYSPQSRKKERWNLNKPKKPTKKTD